MLCEVIPRLSEYTVDGLASFPRVALCPQFTGRVSRNVPEGLRVDSRWSFLWAGHIVVVRVEVCSREFPLLLQLSVVREPVRKACFLCGK